MPQPYLQEDDLWNGLQNSTLGWTYPLQLGIPLLGDVIESLFLIPLGPILPNWTQPIIDKWTGFVDGVKEWFHLRSTEVANSPEDLFNKLKEACLDTAVSLGFSLWGVDGLPSMPPYEEAEDTTPPATGAG